MTHQSIFKREYPNIAPMVYMIATHDRVSEVLHPYPGESVAGNLIVLVGSLCVVRDVETDILAVAYVAVFDHWVGAGAAYANCCSDCGVKLSMRI